MQVSALWSLKMVTIKLIGHYESKALYDSMEKLSGQLYSVQSNLDERALPHDTCECFEDI